MIRTFTFSAALSLPLVFGTLFCISNSAPAQTVQLPTVRTFGVRTVVSVPDRGSIRLGGVNRSTSGSTTRGVPGLGGVPGSGRFFRNRGIGGTASTGNASVSARLIVMSELERDVLAEGNRRHALATRIDPNGPIAVQQKADFISRNIGRSDRR